MLFTLARQRRWHSTPTVASPWLRHSMTIHWRRRRTHLLHLRRQGLHFWCLLHFVTLPWTWLTPCAMLIVEHYYFMRKAYVLSLSLLRTFLLFLFIHYEQSFIAFWVTSFLLVFMDYILARDTRLFYFPWGFLGYAPISFSRTKIIFEAGANRGKLI